MKTQINFLMSQTPHCPYLTVSLHNLRKHYKGEIVVHCWQESYDVCSQIAKDQNLGITIRLRKPDYRGKNDQFFDKIKLMQNPLSISDINMYLDADTMVMRKLDMLFEMANDNGFCATQFNDWTTKNGIVRARIERLRAFPEIDQTIVEDVLDTKFIQRSYNGGVFACHRDSPVLPVWYEWSMIARSIFIADETVLHLMGAKFPKGFVSAYSFNVSPKFQPQNLADDLVGIWHFHGDSNVRPDKSQKGYDIWWPQFEECMSQNVGGMADWIGDCGNKWIRKLRSHVCD